MGGLTTSSEGVEPNRYVVVRADEDAGVKRETPAAGAASTTAGWWRTRRSR